MNEDVKKAWVAALRSGKYKQGRGSLRTPDGEFCCWGVLCDLAPKDVMRDEDWNVWALAPDAVIEWAGLPDRASGTPRVKIAKCRSGAPTPLATLNDTHGATFDEIADAIEAQL